MSVRCVATGSYVPEKIVTNFDWEKQLDTSDEWIQKRTGIVARRFAVEETTADLCVKAAERALKKSTYQANDIDFIIVATMTPNCTSPAIAALVQEQLGATNAFCFDLNAACSGFIFALNTASALLSNQQLKCGLVIGGETMSTSIDWKDRSTAILFGDGAGALLLENDNGVEQTVLATKLHSDGSRAASLVAGERNEDRSVSYLQMEGRAIFDLVIKNVPANILAACHEAKITVDEIDYFILHQANARLLEQVAKKLRVPIEKFPSNIAKYGNTSAASIPILLDELVTEGTIQFGSRQKIVFSGFGGGLSWGTIIMVV